MSLLRFFSVRSAITAAAAAATPSTRTLPTRAASALVGAAPARRPRPATTALAAGPRSASAPAYGAGLDQAALMASDCVIPVDRDDAPLPGRALSKREAHAFSPSRPRGTCHRAFSVFLFNRRNEMLLTRRAATKITFPGVWTNTCCSHPLEGMVPDEVDTNAAYPRFDGAKHAAVRKLGHELGIAPASVPLRDLVFLTRFHYWAADTLTHGPDSPWGEHEIDYVFFIKCDVEPTLRPDPEEVGDHAYVSAARLKECLYDPTKPLRDGEPMLFSPWFRGIMERGGFDWMEDLNGAYSGKYTNEEITYFDPPAEHRATYNLASHGRDTGVPAATGERAV